MFVFCAPIVRVISTELVRGAGLEATGNTVGTPARFTVETYSAGRGQLEVVVLSAHNAREPVRSHTCVNCSRNVRVQCSALQDDTILTRRNVLVRICRRR